MKRLLHFLRGHNFTVLSSAFCAGTNRQPYFYTEQAFCEAWGFTEIILICECGKLKTVRAVGRHTVPTDDAELNALRKLADL